MSQSTAIEAPDCADRTRGRLLVHIPFHYVAHRWQYLETILKGFNDYPLSAIKIVIDSNTSAVTEHLKSTRLGSHCDVRVDVHATLSHPFALTWAHRAHMQGALADYDYFLYIEDDIYIPWSTFNSWLERAPRLDAQGYILGFLRVEKDDKGRTVSTDWMQRVARPRLIAVSGQAYMHPSAFYQACWLYSQERMREFVRSSAWRDGFHKLSSLTRGHRHLGDSNYTREYSALGMSCARPGRPRVLLPLDLQGRVPDTSWVWHLPNNYGNDPTAPGGRLAVDELIVGRPVPTASALGILAWCFEYISESWRWLMYWLHTDQIWEKTRRRLRLT
jgi:hypothetical protein